ncbi:MAG: amino acid ABC transporter permease [Zetaproteobacteria bacterium]|nr:amino acid ABC transporter permease [Zetaproteobacteria bacterium]
MMQGWHTFFMDLVEQMPLILHGVGNTILLGVTISVTGLIFGIVVFYLALSHNVIVRSCVKGYISFFTGMPLIVLLFLMYYGLPSWGVRLSPFVVSVIGFTMNIAAYNAAYLMSGYNSLDAAEIDAAKSQGFTPLQLFKWITLPQVLLLSVPALSNQVIRNIKDTSVAFLIQYTEFFARIQELAASNFQFFKAYFFAGVVYLLLVSLVVLMARWLERHIVIPGLHRTLDRQS